MGQMKIVPISPREFIAIQQSFISSNVGPPTNVDTSQLYLGVFANFSKRKWPLAAILSKVLTYKVYGRLVHLCLIQCQPQV